MVTVTINSVDRTSLVVFNSLRKTDTLNQQVDTLEFKIRKYGSRTYSPTLGHEIVVTSGGSTIFGGVIVKIRESLDSAKIIEYTVTCNDYSQYLKRKLVTERYENTTASAIITDIMGTYTTGFTTAGVAAAVTIASISFNRLTVAESLQKLADAISYVWYVDYDQDLHFFPKNNESAPFDITDTSGNYIYNSLEIVEDLTQVKNSILVQGGEAVSDVAREELFSGDGTKDTFALANKFDSVPTVLVGTYAQTVGTEFLDDDVSFDVMWNFNQKYLRFTSGNTPTSGTNNISVEGTYLYPIVVSVPAPASIAEFGTYQFSITDKSIRSRDEAIDRALAELSAYKDELYEGSFRTYEDGLRSGQVININSTQRGRNIDVLIQSVRMTMRDPNGVSFEYEVRFATLKSIGIIEYLQNQLRSREVIIDDQETLQNYIPLEDTIALTDSLATPVATTGPYLYDTAEYGLAVFG